MKKVKTNTWVKRLSLVMASALLLSSQPAFADNTWDGGGASGVWSDLNNWGANTTPVSPTALVFGGTLQLNSNNDLFAGGTQFNGLTFNAGSGAFTLTGNSILLGGNIVNNSSSTQAINLDIALSAARTVTTNASGNVVLGGVVSGGFNFVKSGFGTLTLNGANVNTYTGQTQVSGGTLLVDYANIATPTNLINSASTLQMGGGNLNIKGKSSGATAQTLGNLSFANNGYNRIALDSNGGTSTTLNLGTLANTAGNVLLFDTSSANTFVTTTTANVNGILPSGRYLVKDATGTGFGTRNGSNQIVRYDDTTGTTLSNAATVSTVNYTTLASGSSFSMLGGAQSLNSLAIDTTNGAQAINMNAGIKTITSGGVIFRGANDATLSNGQLGGNNAETIVHQLGSGKLTVSGQVGSGTASLTKSGTGELVLSGANTYTGATRVNDGTLTLQSSLGATAISLGSVGSTGINPVVNFDTGSSITGGSIALTNANAIVNQTQANAISNTTTFTMTAGTLNLNADNSTAWTSGTMTANANTTIGIGHNNALGARTLTLGGGTIVANGGTRTITNAFNNQNAVSTIGGSNDLNLNGTYTNLGSGTLNITNTGTTTFNGATLGIRDTGTATRSLTIAGTGNSIFNSNITNGSSTNGTLTFTGTGVTTLNGNNTFSGTATIGTLSTTPTVKIGHANALGFGGDSSVAGNTTVNTGATLDLNGTTGINEPIALNGNGVGNNGALINSNTSTEAVIEDGFASIGVGAVGAGYTDGVDIALVPTGGGGTGATAVATVVGGAVTTVRVTNAGSGYTGNPTWSLTSGAGTGAAFTSSASSVTLNTAGTRVGGAGDIKIKALTTGGGGLNKVGAGKLTLAGTVNYTGATTVSNGTLVIASTATYGNAGGTIVNGGTFVYNSSTTFTGSLTLTAGTIKGSGNLGAVALTIGTGVTLSPGNSPGTFNSAGTTTYASGGTYLWEINSVSGTAGADPGWDLALANAINLTATSGSKFNLDIAGLNLSNVSGAVNGWDPNGTYSWIIASATTAVTGFDADAWDIDYSAFSNNNSVLGTFSVSQSGNDILLNYSVPEPSTYALVLGGLGMLAFLRRRNKVSKS